MQGEGSRVILFFFTDIANQCIQYGGQTEFLLSPVNGPPKSGFVPRAQDQGISHREAIRRAPSLPSPVTNSQHAQHASTDKCSPSLTSCEHKDMSVQRDCTLHFSQSHVVNDIYCHRIQSHGSLGFVAGRLSPSAPSPPLSLHNAPAHLHQQYIVAESEFDKFDKSTTVMGIGSVSNIQFDSLRSEPQLVIN